MPAPPALRPRGSAPLPPMPGRPIGLREGGLLPGISIAGLKGTGDGIEAESPLVLSSAQEEGAFRSEGGRPPPGVIIAGLKARPLARSETLPTRGLLLAPSRVGAGDEACCSKRLAMSEAPPNDPAWRGGSGGVCCCC